MWLQLINCWLCPLRKHETDLNLPSWDSFAKHRKAPLIIEMFHTLLILSVGQQYCPATQTCILLQELPCLSVGSSHVLSLSNALAHKARVPTAQRTKSRGPKRHMKVHIFCTTSNMTLAISSSFHFPQSPNLTVRSFMGGVQRLHLDEGYFRLVDWYKSAPHFGLYFWIQE